MGPHKRLSPDDSLTTALLQLSTLKIKPSTHTHKDFTLTPRRQHFVTDITPMSPRSNHFADVFVFADYLLLSSAFTDKRLRLNVTAATTIIHWWSILPPVAQRKLQTIHASLISEEYPLWPVIFNASVSQFAHNASFSHHWRPSADFPSLSLLHGRPSTDAVVLTPLHQLAPPTFIH